MILRRFESDLLLITQVDHAALAGRIASAWRADGFPARPTRAQVLEATREHDIGWLSVDAAPSVSPETGSPYGFIDAPLAIRQGVWPRALDQLAPKDPYVAALVAHHAVTVYRRFLHSPGWEHFFPALERRRDELFAGDFASFLRDYALVAVGDLCSLVFCVGVQDSQSREGYRATLHEDGWLQITPDPFDGATVPLEVSGRRVPDRRYESDADLRDTVARAPIVKIAGVARA